MVTLSGSVLEVRARLLQVAFNPVADLNGVAQISLIVSDDDERSVSATVPVNIAPRPDGPTVSVLSTSIVIDEDDPFFFSAGFFDLEDIDSSDFVASVSVTSGTLTAVGVASATVSGFPGESGQIAGSVLFVELSLGTLMYVPEPNFNGNVTLSVTVEDDTDLTAETTVLVSVSALNDAPSVVTSASSVSVNEDDSVNLLEGGVSLSVTDPDGDSSTYSVAFSCTSCTLDAVRSVFTDIAGERHRDSHFRGNGLGRLEYGPEYRCLFAGARF